MPFATDLDYPVFLAKGSEIRLNYALITVAMAEYLTIACGFICARRLYRCTGKVTHPLPIASILIIAATAVTTGLQIFFPGILPALERNWGALRAGEWWRIVTPMLIQPCGWGQHCWNGLTAFLLLPLAEKCYGHRLWALYFGSGLMGQVVHYAFDPSPASGGSSTAIYGVMGALFAFAWRHGRGLSGTSAVCAILGLGGAAVQSVFQDFHGVGMLTGALLAAGMRSRLPTGPKAPASTLDAVAR